MTTSARETALLALLARLQTLTGPRVERETVVPERIPAGGLIILRDGQPGEPDITLSPLRYHYAHRARLEVLVQPLHSGTGDGRHAALDDVLQQVGLALEADRTLGGAVTWGPPQIVTSGWLGQLGASSGVRTGAVFPSRQDWAVPMPSRKAKLAATAGIWRLKSTVACRPTSTVPAAAIAGNT